MTVIDFGSEVGMLIVSLHAERNVIKNVWWANVAKLFEWWSVTISPSAAKMVRLSCDDCNKSSEACHCMCHTTYDDWFTGACWWLLHETYACVQK